MSRREARTRSMIMSVHKPTGKIGEKGVYTILIHVDPSVWIKIGKLGLFKFSGDYAYTGSAIGSGSSSLSGRLSRHLSSGKKMRWHIDYLLKHPNTKIIGIVSSVTTSKLKECETSRCIHNLTGILPIKGFGSSDCSCISHLAHFTATPDHALQVISEAHLKSGLKPRITRQKCQQNIIIQGE